MDLVRHMPFVRRDSAFDGEIDPYQIYEQTSAVDYNGQEFRRAASASIRHRADPIEEETTIPSHVLTLANTAGGRDGHYIFLDTERGTITICDFQIGPKYTDLSQVRPSLVPKVGFYRHAKLTVGFAGHRRRLKGDLA